MRCVIDNYYSIITCVVCHKPLVPFIKVYKNKICQYAIILCLDVEPHFPFGGLSSFCNIDFCRLFPVFFCFVGREVEVNTYYNPRTPDCQP